MRELVSQIGQSELKPRSYLPCVRDGVRHVGEQSDHLFRRLWISLRVAFQEPACTSKRCVMTQTGECVEYLPAARFGVTHSIGGHQGQAQAAPQLDHRLVASFLVTMKMSLQFQID